MTILSLLALLAGSQWSTNCVMTQTDQQQGYTIDAVQFAKTASNFHAMDASFTRAWYKDEKCSEMINTQTSATQVTLGNPIQTLGFNGTPLEYTFEADFTANGKTNLGALAIASDGSSIRLAKDSFGFSRNTMLSLFRYLKR